METDDKIMCGAARNQHLMREGVIRVLHLVHSFETGGAERVVLDLTQHSSPAISNYVCSFCQPNANDLISQLDLARTGFRCLRKRVGNDPRMITALGHLIDEERIDVVHALGWGTFLEGLIAAKWYAKRRTAFIYAFHGKILEDVERGMLLRRRIAQRIGHHFTDACIAPAGHMADEYAQVVGLQRHRIDVIHNGIDVHRFNRKRRQDSRAALGLASDDFVVGFVGRLAPVKDIRGIVEVFARFRRGLEANEGKTRLLIVGDGPERGEAERIVVAYNLCKSVLFAGWRADTQECLAAMDVYLQPSYYEGHSISLLEALATRLPIISTSVGGTPEIICHGSNGFLYQPGDYDQMAKALVDLYREPALATKIGLAGWERVVKYFSVMMMVGRYEELYRRVLKT